jgi:outer membrane biogenesis lipoprotein LolB
MRRFGVALAAMGCLLLAACSGLQVQPVTTTLWESEVFTNRPPQEWCEAGYLDYEFGRRSDGVVVWRSQLKEIHDDE